MVPEIVECPQMFLVGVMHCAKDLAEVDIHGLWDMYGLIEPLIENRIDGAWYELHVGAQQGHGLHSVVAGVAVSELGSLPIECVLKVIPQGIFTHFSHSMKEGGYDGAFRRIDKWVHETGTETRDYGLQLFDSAFNPEDEDSILHVYIPLA